MAVLMSLHPRDGQADAEYKGKDWLVFGTGPHYYLGQQYAVVNLMVKPRINQLSTIVTLMNGIANASPSRRRSKSVQSTVSWVDSDAHTNKVSWGPKAGTVDSG